jgi:hypothetical protein
MRRFWTTEENKLLIKYYPDLCWDELYNLFPSRTYSAILKHAQKLNIKREFPRDIDRFLAQIDCDMSDKDRCWNWTGAVMHNGYGQFGRGGGYVLAHRWSYEYFIEIIPPGHDCHHVCYNRQCVNPYHLKPLTNKENVLDGNGPTAINARKTHCKRGHALSGNNLALWKAGGRRCKKCMNDRKQARRRAGCGY